MARERETLADCSLPKFQIHTNTQEMLSKYRVNNKAARLGKAKGNNTTTPRTTLFHRLTQGSKYAPMAFDMALNPET